MTQFTNQKFPTKSRLSAITSRIAVGLLFFSSPFVVTSASWAQQASEVPLTNSPDVKISVPLQGNNSQPSISVAPDKVSPAIPVLLQVLQGRQPQAGFDASSAIPVLIQGLQGGSPDVRTQAISAMPGIIKALQGENSPAQPQAQPQAQVQPQSQPKPRTKVAGNCVVTNPASIVPGLIQGLSNQDEIVRFFAASALACIGEGATSAVPNLLGNLQDPDKSVRLVAALALDAIGTGFQHTARQLSSGESSPLLSNFGSVLNLVTDPLLKLPQTLLNPQQQTPIQQQVPPQQQTPIQPQGQIPPQQQIQSP
ncbi:HEAT repeat domain-containing protein [Chlorogloeopsis sp. ULAP02]|uniref:HEAT repeat domain-containing protein n=1 Tax=Chlorogloeopsis sp. ULAP02 TaxID=3107926 RepID=UPI00313739E6